MLLLYKVDTYHHVGDGDAFAPNGASGFSFNSVPSPTGNGLVREIKLNIMASLSLTSRLFVLLFISTSVDLSSAQTEAVLR